MHYLKKDSGIVPNGGETQASLDACESWVGEGGQWVPDYLNDCATPRSCRNLEPTSGFPIKCVDFYHYIEDNSMWNKPDRPRLNEEFEFLMAGLAKLGTPLKQCSDYGTKYGGRWEPDYFEPCVKPSK